MNNQTVGLVIFLVGLAILMGLMTLVFISIWTGDPRWAYTALGLAVPPALGVGVIAFAYSKSKKS